MLLSIVVATTKPWPEIAPCLASLQTQIKDLEVELLIVDGQGQGLTPQISQSCRHLRWIKQPEASVFQLRALGVLQAQGNIIAITEDHCQVTPSWCQAILQAHQRYPNAAAVGGVVLNGATAHLVDWANYFLVFAPFMPPIKNGPTTEISLQANISYKRSAIAKLDPELGLMEMLYNRALVAQKQMLVADNSIQVYHVQSHGFWQTPMIHFHNGRSIAGFRSRLLPRWRRLVYLLGCWILPFWLLSRTVGAILQKRCYLLPAFLSLPILILLCWSHAIGELVGYLTGPGQSPQRLV